METGDRMAEQVKINRDRMKPAERRFEFGLIRCCGESHTARTDTDQSNALAVNERINK